MDYKALKDELTLDPRNYGYGAFLDVEKMTTREQIERAGKDEEGRDRWKYAEGQKYSAGRSDVGLKDILMEVRTAIVLSYTDSLTGLPVVRTGSRVEELCGPGTSITPFDIAIAFDATRT